MTKLKTPIEFICPITRKLFDDPVIASDGKTYERKAIEQWFEENNISPVTGILFTSKHLIKDSRLFAKLEQFFKSNNLSSKKEFFSAISSKNIESLEKLNYLTEYLEDVNSDGNSPLHVAVIAKNIDALQFLLGQGMVIDQKHILGETSLHIAAHRGLGEIVQFLIVHHANQDELTKDDESAFQLAIIHGHIDTVEIMLKHNVALASSRFQNGLSLTPLLQAACAGYLNIMQILLKTEGVSLNELVENAEQTPLILAAYRGHLDIVQWLVEVKKVSSTQPGNDFITPFMASIYNNHQSIVEYFLTISDDFLQEKDDNGMTPLLTAAREGHGNLVEVLLQSGASLNEIANDGTTLLHFSAYKGHLDLVKFFIKKNLLLTLNPGDSGSPIEAAHCNEQWHVVKYLLKIGAAIGLTKENPFYTADNFTKDMLVIGLIIDGETVTRKTPGFEHAFTNLQELVENETGINHCIKHHDTIIRVCNERLAENPDNKEIQLLKNKVILLSGKGLQISCQMAINKNAFWGKEKLKEKLPESMIKNLEEREIIEQPLLSRLSQI